VYNMGWVHVEVNAVKETVGRTRIGSSFQLWAPHCCSSVDMLAWDKGGLVAAVSS
jgi:hypothetical protein